MNEHERFELLCTLAVIGQIRDVDLRELKRHVEDCIDCQHRISDFAQISAQALPLLGDEYHKPRPPQGMATRFVERARAEGIPLQTLGQIFPSCLSFECQGWNGALAIALLLIVIITAGISHSFHWRPRLGTLAETAEFRLLDERPVQTKAVEHRSESQNAGLLHVPTQMPLSGDRSSSARAHRHLNFGRRDRSEDLRPIPSDVQRLENYYNARMVFASEILSSGVQKSPLELFQAYGNSARPLLTAQLRMPLTQHNPFADKTQYRRIGSGDHLISASVLLPDLTLRALHFEGERVLRTGFDRSSSELKLDIDWCAVSKCAPRTWMPGLPLSNDGKAQQQ